MFCQFYICFLSSLIAPTKQQQDLIARFPKIDSVSRAVINSHFACVKDRITITRLLDLHLCWPRRWRYATVFVADKIGNLLNNLPGDANISCDSSIQDQSSPAILKAVGEDTVKAFEGIARCPNSIGYQPSLSVFLINTGIEKGWHGKPAKRTSCAGIFPSARASFVNSRISLAKTWLALSGKLLR